MLALPLSLFEPVWQRIAALLPAQPALAPTDPLGCHRRRIPDRTAFEHAVDAPVQGFGYERYAP